MIFDKLTKKAANTLTKLSQKSYFSLLPFQSFQRRISNSIPACACSTYKGKLDGDGTIGKMNFAPAADRNKEPILEVLKQILPQPGDSSASNSKLKAIEIASGTGQHVTHLAQYFKNIEWLPSDINSRDLSSINNYVGHLGLKDNVKDATIIDVSLKTSNWTPQELFPPASYDLIYCANMIHISPYKCTLGLFAAAGVLLKPEGLLITYGPYAEGGVLVPDSNVNFNLGLKSQNPEWGIRDIDDLVKLAKENNLNLFKRFDMPANNKTLVFKKV